MSFKSLFIFYFKFYYY